VNTGKNIKRESKRLFDDTPYNLDLVADICYYQEVEKRGFYVKFKNVILKKEDLYQYALRKMSDNVTNDWVIIKNGKNKNQ
jgi:hypothetical protein